MKMSNGFLVAAALLGAIQAASAGDITGKITLKGAPPPEKEIPLDPTCGKLHQEKLKTRFYLVDQGGGLEDVFVYIKDGLTGKKFPVSTEPVVLDQKGCEYVPYVLGLQAGQKLLVKNSDPGIFHNVHPTPDPKIGNKESNKAQPPGVKPFEYVFDNPEVFLRFKCDVHPWMFSYVGVLPHSFYGVSGKGGTFKIPNVPPGKYTIEAIHRKSHPGGKGITKEITVGPDGAKVDFTVEVASQ